MAMRMGGSRRKARYKLRKEVRQKGKISFTKYFQSFEIGEKVYLTTEPAVQGGMYHLRFFGKSGVISGKRGRCYQVEIKDGGKTKNLLVHPIHMNKVPEAKVA